jgi:hypothetical protein
VVQRYRFQLFWVAVVKDISAGLTFWAWQKAKSLMAKSCIFGGILYLYCVLNLSTSTDSTAHLHFGLYPSALGFKLSALCCALLGLSLSLRHAHKICKIYHQQS